MRLPRLRPSAEAVDDEEELNTPSATRTERVVTRRDHVGDETEVVWCRAEVADQWRESVWREYPSQ